MWSLSLSDCLQVTLHFKLDSNGLVALSRAEATCEQNATVTDKAENKTDAKEETKEETKEEKESEEEAKDEAEEETKDEAEDKAEDTAETKKDKKDEKKKSKKDEKKKDEKKKDKKEKKKESVFRVELVVSEDVLRAEAVASSALGVAESKDKLAYLQALDNDRFLKVFLRF